MNLKDELVALSGQIKQKFPGLIGEVKVELKRGTGQDPENVAYNEKEGLVYLSGYGAFPSRFRVTETIQEGALLRIMDKVDALVALIKDRHDLSKSALSSLGKAKDMLK